MGQGSRRVAFQNGAAALKDDGAGVVGGVDEMDGAAGDLRAVVEHRLMDALAIETRPSEGGEKRGVNVHRLAGPFRGDFQQGQPTGQADQSDAHFIAPAKYAFAELRDIGEFFPLDDFRLQARVFGAIDSGDSGLGGDDQENLCAEFAGVDAVDEILQGSP